MTVRWNKSQEVFDVGLSIGWGDRRHRSLVAGIHLGIGSVLIIWRWWL